MSETGDSDVQQDNAALLLWSLGAWHRQQQRYREWLANHRRNQQHLRAISKVQLLFFGYGFGLVYETHQSSFCLLAKTASKLSS